jgi:lipopolysaccharide transport system ATP-binding protein
MTPPPTNRPPSDNDVLVRVEGVGKKFCRDLKKSLWYGMKDIAAELLPGERDLERHATLRPGEFWAVDDVSFELRRGECLGLIGRNGAGKTTLLKMLNGLIKPDKGRIEIRGRVAALIALGAGFNPILTGRENIYVNAAILGMSRQEVDDRVDRIVEFAELREFIDMPVQSYSSGMAVRLGFAIAVHTEPDVLLLDEVLAVGDVGFQAKCFNALAEFRERGTAFILVSHNMHQISRYARDVLLLKAGRITFHGRAEQGIHHYLTHIGRTAQSGASEVVDWSQIHGTGKLTFVGARFLDQRGAVITAIDVGDPVVLELDYRREPGLERTPVLDLLIKDFEGVIYQGTSAGTEAASYPLPVAGTFRVAIGSIFLNTDYLDFFIAALDPQTTEVFDWKRHIRLLIRRRDDQIGKLILSVDWSSV